MTLNDSKMNLIVIAGEVSGDIHGAHLIAALKSKNPGLEISGIGGDLMIKEGLRSEYHIKQMAFLGFVEVLKHLPFINKVFRNMYALAKSIRPAAIILIDYPGFNLRFAKKVKKLGIPVIYYISPQLWAWGKKRVYKIKKYIDKMFVIFPFEKEFYAKYGIQADYVGHPLADNHYNDVNPKKMTEEKRILGLLPGSRLQEIDKLLPDMLRTAEILISAGQITEALILKVGTIPAEIYESYIGGKASIRLIESESAKFYNQIDAALVSSGTATLESAYFQVPLVIVYRVSRLTWTVANIFVKLDMIGLANIVAEKYIAKELLQYNFKPLSASVELERLLEPQTNKQVRNELKIIRKKLGPPGASERAAELIINFISG